MFGKVVQLLNPSMSDDQEIVYGINLDNNLGRYHLNFGTISFANLNPATSKTYIYGGHIVTEKGDGFKDVLIFNGNLSENNNEEYLLVVIPYAAQITTSGKKIAGRYYNEAILEMFPGDTVKIKHSIHSKSVVYMAVQAGNEMFLIKKNR